VTVAQANRIDSITRSSDGRAYTLLMLEPRPFDGSAEQEQQLITKANGYMAFIQSGQLYDTVPGAQGKELRVRLVCQSAPDDDRLREVLGAMTAMFAGRRVEFAVEVIPPELLPQ
jgi:hypothetical protein